MSRSYRLMTASTLALLMTFAQCAYSDPGSEANATPRGASIEQGRYVVKIASCNNCHTEGYVAAAGKVDERQWLTGSRVGYRGDWGTTYGVNLRLYMEKLSEEQWVETARTVVTRPPMERSVLRALTEDDLRSIYRFIKHLGPAGEPAPAALPPDQEPKGPYILYPHRQAGKDRHALTGN